MKAICTQNREVVSLRYASIKQEIAQNAGTLGTHFVYQWNPENASSHLYFGIYLDFSGQKLRPV